MALCSKFQVELPKKGIIIAKTRKYPYVYHVDSYYRNKNGTPTHSKRSIGKFDRDTGMLIPNKTYFEIYDEEPTFVEKLEQSELEVTYGKVCEIGVILIVEAIFSSLGITEILCKIVGENRYKSILTVSAYMLAEGNVMNYIDDFSENTSFDAILTDKAVSRLFASLTNSERMAFFKEWVKLHIQNEYIAYDVTSFSTYAKNIDDAEYGYNRDNESLPQINMALYMGQTSLLPMFYVTYAGSIIDKSHLKFMMAYNSELEIENVSFVMDRGFASTDNAEFMRANGYPFILGAEFRLKAIQQAFAENKDSIHSAENYILNEKVYGLPVKGRFYRIASTLHIFFDPAAVAQQTEDFFRKIVVEENELAQLKKLDDSQMKIYSKHFVITVCKNGFSFERDNAKINKICARFGYFFLLTNKSLSSEEVISAYRRRDIIEKGFDEIKNGLDMNRLRTHNSDTTDGKLFCAFLSLICRLHMQNKLSKFIDQNNFTNERIIRELSKIRAIKVGDKICMLNPLSKIQREIIFTLGLNIDAITSFIASLDL